MRSQMLKHSRDLAGNGKHLVLYEGDLITVALTSVSHQTHLRWRVGLVVGMDARSVSVLINGPHLLVLQDTSLSIELVRRVRPGDLIETGII